MRLRPPIIFGIALSLLVHGTACAATSDALLQSCRAVIKVSGASRSAQVEIPVEGLQCWYYFSAVQNLSALVDQNGDSLLGICPAPQTTLMDFVGIFVRYAGTHPDTANEADNPAALAITGLAAAFPCSGGNLR